MFGRGYSRLFVYSPDLLSLFRFVSYPLALVSEQKAFSAKIDL
jgi:hypothetical protein